MVYTLEEALAIKAPSSLRRHKAVFAIYRLSDLTYREIGDRMGITPARVQQIVKRWERYVDLRFPGKYGRDVVTIEDLDTGRLITGPAWKQYKDLTCYLYEESDQKGYRGRIVEVIPGKE